MVERAKVAREGFNEHAEYPYNLRADVFAIAMEDIYEMLASLNQAMLDRGLLRIEESVRGAIYSGMLSDLLTEAISQHASGLTTNRYPNGHPDLIPIGRYANDSAQSADDGVEVKVTKKPSGAVDMHGARPAWYCVFRYEVDDVTEPAVERAPTRFTSIWLARLSADDFRRNPRGELGTRTATPHREGVKKLRAGWIYREAE